MQLGSYQKACKNQQWIGPGCSEMLLILNNGNVFPLHQSKMQRALPISSVRWLFWCLGKAQRSRLITVERNIQGSV